MAAKHCLSFPSPSSAKDMITVHAAKLHSCNNYLANFKGAGFTLFTVEERRTWADSKATRVVTSVTWNFLSVGALRRCLLFIPPHKGGVHELENRIVNVAQIYNAVVSTERTKEQLSYLNDWSFLFTARWLFFLISCAPCAFFCSNPSFIIN